MEGWNIDNWRASEASEELSGVYKFELVQYVYIYINSPLSSCQVLHILDIVSRIVAAGIKLT